MWPEQFWNGTVGRQRGGSANILLCTPDTESPDPRRKYLLPTFLAALCVEHASMHPEDFDVSEVAEEAENPDFHLGPSQTRVHEPFPGATDMVAGFLTCYAKWCRLGGLRSTQHRQRCH